MIWSFGTLRNGLQEHIPICCAVRQAVFLQIKYSAPWQIRLFLDKRQRKRHRKLGRVKWIPCEFHECFSEYWKES